MVKGLAGSTTGWNAKLLLPPVIYARTLRTKSPLQWPGFYAASHARPKRVWSPLANNQIPATVELANAFL